MEFTTFMISKAVWNVLLLCKPDGLFNVITYRDAFRRYLYIHRLREKITYTYTHTQYSYSSEYFLWLTTIASSAYAYDKWNCASQSNFLQ